MGVIVGYNADPNNGADNYGVGFHAGLRIVIPSTGSPTKTITKIGGWVQTNGSPTTEAFRFAISNADNANNQNEETDVASRLYYSPSNILLSSLLSSAGSANFQETVSIPIAAGAVIFGKQITAVAGDIRFKYLDGQAGQRIYDAFYGGGAVPPSDPLSSGDINYYDGYVYGIWIEVEDDSGGGITGSLSLAETNDSIASAGALSVVASLVVSESADAVLSSATASIQSALSLTEQSESLASALAISIVANAALIETADSLAATGLVSVLGAITGSLSLTEANDSIAASGALSVAASLVVTGSADSVLSSAAASIQSAFSLYAVIDCIYRCYVFRLALNCFVFSQFSGVSQISSFTIPFALRSSRNRCINTDFGVGAFALFVFIKTT